MMLGLRPSIVEAPPHLRLTPLELATGRPLGADETVPRLPQDSGVDPVAALEAALLPALRRPPCLVSFSGGRDSSAVLAVAARVARREGLPLPVPATLRFDSAPQATETEWQELVVRHLELPDWHRRSIADELDMLGPIARDRLKRHGVLWPLNAHFFVPLVREMASSTLVTGVDGDGLMLPNQWSRVNDVLGRRVRPVSRDALRLLRAVAPSWVQRRWWHHRGTTYEYPWLRPAARTRFAASWARDQAGEPVHWNARVRWWRSRRYLNLAVASMGLLAEEVGCRLFHPLLEPQFVAAVIRHGGRFGFGDRTTTMRVLFGEVLPGALIARSSKAVFDEVYWGPHSQSFAESWNGSGVDSELVDADALRDVWIAAESRADSWLLLQAAWLAQAAETSAD